MKFQKEERIGQLRALNKYRDVSIKRILPPDRGPNGAGSVGHTVLNKNGERVIHNMPFPHLLLGMMNVFECGSRVQCVRSVIRFIGPQMPYNTHIPQFVVNSPKYRLSGTVLSDIFGTGFIAEKCRAPSDIKAVFSG